MSECSKEEKSAEGSEKKKPQRISEERGQLLEATENGVNTTTDIEARGGFGESGRDRRQTYFRKYE